jgi:hypothetical protein
MAMPILRRVIAIMVLGCCFAAGTPRASTARAGETPERDVGQESETLRRQLQEVEIELEKMKGLMPPTVDSAFETYVNERATRAGLSAVEIERVATPEAVSLDDGRPSGVELRRLDFPGAISTRRCTCSSSFSRRDAPRASSISRR